MLRAFVLLLLLANLTFLGWTQGWLAPLLGPVPTGREPERLERQLNPDAVRILNSDGAPPASAAAPTSAPPPLPPPPAIAPLPPVPPLPPLPTTPAAPPAPAAATPAPASAVASAVAQRRAECLEAGPFNEGEGILVESAANASLPAGSWKTDRSVKPETWMVYMGKYPDRAAMRKKADELARLGVQYQVLRSNTTTTTNTTAPPEYGLSLGVFSAKQSADNALASLTKKGVHTARVVQMTPSLVTLWLRVPAADEAVRARLNELQPQLFGKALAACRNPGNPANPA